MFKHLPFTPMTRITDPKTIDNLNGPGDVVYLQCQYFNETLCSNGYCGPKNVTKCAQESTSNGLQKYYCYSLWSNVTDDSTNTSDGNGLKSAGRVTLRHAGCLTGHNGDCVNSTTCIASRYTKEHYFCCCYEDFCNRNVHLLSNIPGELIVYQIFSSVFLSVKKKSQLLKRNC